MVHKQIKTISDLFINQGNVKQNCNEMSSIKIKSDNTKCWGVRGIPGTPVLPA